MSPRTTARLANIDHSGRATNDYAATIDLSGDHPGDRPWALHLTDYGGRFWLLGFDLDAHTPIAYSSSSRPDTPATGIAGVSGRPTPPAVGWRTAPRWWWRGLRLHLMTWRDLAVFVAWLCCLVVLAFPAVARLDRRVRRDARQHRALALRWGGVRVPAAYRTAVDPLAQGYGGRADQVVGWLREPINRRDLRWHLLGTVVAGLIAAVPPFLVVWMLWGLLQPIMWPIWHEYVGQPFVYFFPVWSWPSAFVAAGWGVFWFFVSMRWYPAIVWAYVRTVA